MSMYTFLRCILLVQCFPIAVALGAQHWLGLAYALATMVSTVLGAMVAFWVAQQKKGRQ